jgi:subtilisin-like proprotein convertase family protein
VFDGELVNRKWQLIVGDTTAGNAGIIDWWHLYVYYNCTPPLRGR